MPNNDVDLASNDVNNCVPTSVWYVYFIAATCDSCVYCKGNGIYAVAQPFEA